VCVGSNRTDTRVCAPVQVTAAPGCCHASATSLVKKSALLAAQQTRLLVHVQLTMLFKLENYSATRLSYHILNVTKLLLDWSGSNK